MSTPFLPVLLSWTYAYDCSCYKAFDSSVTLAWIAAQSQYYSHKSYNVDHGNRLQVPIFSYMVSEYRQTHSLRKPTVVMLWFFSCIEIDDLKEKLKMATLVSSSNSSGKKSKSKRRVSCSSQAQNDLPKAGQAPRPAGGPPAAART
ncbi:putative INO80 complex subunit C-like isoform 1 [Capsicum annuum]|nr:putative INO80 complex subunit C-like isoform 1 [Capsicum annuum]